jgi:hypothetical protein
MALPSPHRLDLAPHEEAFLRRYSESLVRLTAMVDSGAAFALALDPLQDVVALEAAATRIIAKAEQLNLAQLASATALDKLYFLARLKAVCDDPEGHIAIKGLQLLARIHGVWDKADRAHANVQIVFGTPSPQRAQNDPDLPFSIDVTPTKPTT